MGSADVPFDHYVSWHTGDGVTLDLLRKLTPIVHHLIHDAIVLTVGTLGSLATLCLAEIDDGLHCILGVNLNLVENVGVAHGVSPCRCSYYRALRRRWSALEDGSSTGHPFNIFSQLLQYSLCSICSSCFFTSLHFIFNFFSNRCMAANFTTH